MISHLALILCLRRQLGAIPTLEPAENGVKDVILELRVDHS
jgi:hypothetical protein